MNHDFYMQQALVLAGKGWPAVAPNPMVGCVIVKGEAVVASGYHTQYGAPHAEVMAIQSLPAEIDPADCRLYVTLEPCSHFGKTPPCADLIIGKGFRQVIVACKDPNPLVSGRGMERLRKSGVEVTEGILESEARELNKRFITFFEKKRPWYTLKWAITADNFISRTPPLEREQNRITGPAAQELVHRLRAENMGILIGKNTALHDNPRLTTRLVAGENPTRILIDRRLEVPEHFHIYDGDAPLIVFNERKDEEHDWRRFVRIDFSDAVLAQVSAHLYALNVQSVLVEGGAYVLNEFISQRLWDEALVFQNPDLTFGSGIPGPVFALRNSFELVGNDKLYRHRKGENA